MPNPEFDPHARQGVGGLLTPAEAMERLRVCEKVLRRLRQRGEIRYVAITDRKIMYRPEDCEEYLASRVRRNEPLAKPSRPARIKGRQQRGVVVPFERMAAERGW